MRLEMGEDEFVVAVESDVEDTDDNFFDFFSFWNIRKTSVHMVFRKSSKHHRTLRDFLHLKCNFKNGAIKFFKINCEVILTWLEYFLRLSQISKHSLFSRLATA
jgi:hypothetical protein